MSFQAFTLEGTGGKSVLINPAHVTHVQPSRVDANTPTVIHLLSGGHIQVTETASEVAKALGFGGEIAEPKPAPGPTPQAPPPPGIPSWSTIPENTSGQVVPA